MGSSAQDKNTQSASSQAALKNSATAATNSQDSINNSNAAYGKLLANTSQFANPASLNQNGLNSTYQNAYNVAANQNAQGAQHAVQTSQQAAASRGAGATPAGFSTDQARQAYQTQAGNNASTYSGLSMQQLQDAITQYQYANNQLASYGQGQANLGQQYLSGASNTNTSLYGTSSQQKQSPWGAVLGVAAGLGGSAITKYCWIAEAIYGEDADETHVLRAYLSGPFRQSLAGRLVMNVYGAIGKRVAAQIRKREWLKHVMQPVFELALNRALVEFA